MLPRACVPVGELEAALHHLMVEVDELVQLIALRPTVDLAEPLTKRVEAQGNPRAFSRQ